MAVGGVVSGKQERTPVPARCLLGPAAAALVTAMYPRVRDVVE